MILLSSLKSFHRKGWYCAPFITPRTYTSFPAPLVDLHPGRRV
jgi:hypothetical protein